MLKALKWAAVLLVGFALYPLLFVPVMNLWFPEALEWWIHRYADYLKLWGM